MNELLVFIIGALSASVCWFAADIYYARQFNQLFLEYGNRKYQQGYDHGRKSATLYPHAT
jgi:predicted TIM-barrel fold metal-dependent hydrolase